jgi:predicted PurR-regulated permease PerM
MPAAAIGAWIIAAAASVAATAIIFGVFTGFLRFLPPAGLGRL